MLAGATSPTLIHATPSQQNDSVTSKPAAWEITFDESPTQVIPTGQTGATSLVPSQRGKALLTEVPTTGTAHLRYALPAEKLRGANVSWSAMVKADNVTTPPAIYNGVKVMLHTRGESGDQWLQENSVWGSFDWKQVFHTARLADDLTTAELILGLENTTGRAWFDDVRITIERPARQRPAVPHAGMVYKGHRLPRLRGTMVGMNMRKDDLRTLGRDWNANLVRWQFTWKGFPASPADTATVAEYDAWLESELIRLDKALPLCEKYGLMVVVDVHTSPGGRDAQNVCRLFHENQWQDYFVSMWKKIAQRYRGKKIIWGYDLVNEPVEGSVPPGLMNWNQLAAVTAKRVYEIDPDHAIIVEPAPWGGAEAIDNLDIIPLPNIVYSVHMYIPHAFTHQGVNGTKMGFTYPGIINGTHWDKHRLRKILQKVRDFQIDYGVHIFLGEFSAIRWAPGDSAALYLRDLIEIFEEFGWDWAYHAYREWNGWSVEHSADPEDNSPASTPTERQTLLMKYFAKNQKPDLSLRPQ